MLPMPIHWQTLKKHRHEAPWLLLDLFMLVLITVDLLWLLVDSLLLKSGFGLLLNEYRPDLVPYYRDHWHHPGLLYDSLLTGILLAELCLRWGIAVVRKTYHRWFFYPFIHWYDVLGCLPGLQGLRLLRVISMFYRLNRMGLLLIGTGLIETARKYYNVILEEISDRIVLNVLEGVQREIRSGGPVAGQVRERILDPHREVLVNWLAGRLSQVADHGYRHHEQALASYLEQVTAEAIRANPEWQALRRRLPVIGGRLEQELNDIVSSLVNSMASRLIADLGAPDNRALTILADSLYVNFTHPDLHLSRAVEQIALEVLDLIKSQVSVQQWKREEAAGK